MGIISGTVKTIVTGVAVRKAVELASDGVSKLSEKIEKNRPKDVEENVELLDTEYNYNLRVLKTETYYDENSTGYDYSVFDKDGYELYKIKNEKAKCSIINCHDQKRRLAILFREKKNIKYYTIVEGTKLSEVICDGSVTKKLVKDSTGATKKSSVKEYLYKDNGWILEEEYASHKATLAKSRSSEPFVTILYSGSDFAIGYDDETYEETALLAACLTIVEESKVDNE